MSKTRFSKEEEDPPENALKFPNSTTRTPKIVKTVVSSSEFSKTVFRPFESSSKRHV